MVPAPTCWTELPSGGTFTPSAGRGRPPARATASAPCHLIGRVVGGRHVRSAGANSSRTCWRQYPQAPGWWPHFPTLTRRRGLPHRSECGVWENPAGLRQCAMVQTRAGEPLGTLTDSSFTRQNSRSASPSQLGAADCRFRSRSQQVILEITVPAADQLSFALTIRGYRRLGSTQHCAQ